MGWSRSGVPGRELCLGWTIRHWRRGPRWGLTEGAVTGGSGRRWPLWEACRSPALLQKLLRLCWKVMKSC